MSKQITMLIRSPTDCPFRRPLWYRGEDGETHIRRYECNSYECAGIDCPDDKFDVNCPLLDAKFEEELTESKYVKGHMYHKVLFR